MDGNVRIGREFFQKVKLDYADWAWALVREFMQNCMDAPNSTRIDVKIVREGSNTRLSVFNNGEPMGRDTLVNKLLTLGGSGKNFVGGVGGFGVAKSLLYYTHLNYTIRTGNLLVAGEGGQYTITEQDSLAGTQSDVLVEGDVVNSLSGKFRRFASMAQWAGKLVVNGEDMPTNTRKGMRRKEFAWGTIYTNRSFSNQCVVRLNGQPMFTRYCQFRGCVLVELKGTSGDVLTSNRDSLKADYAEELAGLITALAVDKRSALREQRAEYKRWAGERQRNEAKQPKAAGELASIVREAMEQNFAAVGSAQGVPAATVDTGDFGIKVIPVSRQESTVSIGPEFIVKNTTGRTVPKQYQPGEKFSKYARDLVRAWCGVLVKLHQVLNVPGDFSIGFVFDEDSEAECERSGDYGLVYYINPAKLKVKYAKSGARMAFQRVFKSAWKDRAAIIAKAAHEIVHGAYGLHQHDEEYAGKLTNVMEAALREMKQLSAACRRPRKARQLELVS